MLKADIIVSETDKATIFVVVPSERLFPECAEFSSLSFSVRFLKWFPVLFAVKSPAGMLEGEWVVFWYYFPEWHLPHHPSGQPILKIPWTGNKETTFFAFLLHFFHGQIIFKKLLNTIESQVIPIVK